MAVKKESWPGLWSKGWIRCCLSESSWEIAYTVSGPVSATASELFNSTIPPLTTVPFLFFTPVDFSAPGTYTIRVKTHLVGDEFPDNDLVFENPVDDPGPGDPDTDLDDIGLLIGDWNGNGVEDGDPLHLLPALAWCAACDDVRAVTEHEARAGTPFPAGDALYEHALLAVDDDRHPAPANS